VNELRTRKNGLSRTNQRYRRRSPSCSQSLRALRGEARRLSFGGVDWHGVAQDGRGAGHTFSDATTNPSAEPRLLLLMGSAIGSLDGRHVTFAAAPRGIARCKRLCACAPTGTVTPLSLTVCLSLMRTYKCEMRTPICLAR
jgi:hypothetical protein